MKDILDFISKNLAVFTGLIGLFLGSWTQRDLLKKQIIRDEKKEIRSDLKETLSIYNKVLKADGEHLIVVHVGGSQYDFELELYKNEIRPILYERYHLLHDNVAQAVASIDHGIQKCEHYEEIEREDHEFFNRAYHNMIRDIRKHIFEFRKNK
jgi:hypothetical protein